MGDHVAGPVPSQVANPWRAAWRTVVQVGVPAFLLVLVAGPAVLQILADELGGVLPPGVISWLLGAAAVLTAVAGALARISALPAVNAWLGRFGLDAGPPISPAAPLDGDVAARGADGWA